MRRFERVVAVEPLDGMRGVLEELVPEADVFRGTAEDIPVVTERGLERGVRS